MVNAGELINRMTKYIRYVAPSDKDMPPIVALIRQSKENRKRGMEAKEWLGQPFSPVFMAFIEKEAERFHNRLIKKEISADTYSEVFLLLSNIAAYPTIVVKDGETAAQYLKQCQEDGTLDEAELYQGTTEEV